MPSVQLDSGTSLEDWFAIFSQRRHCVWLDSVDGARGADWSVLAADPVEVRVGPRDHLLDWLTEWEERLQTCQTLEIPFVGGVIGQLDYEDEIPGYPPAESPRLSGWLGLYETALVEHRPTGKVFAVAGEWIESAEARLADWVEALPDFVKGKGDRKPVVKATRPVPNLSRDEYLRKVEQVRKWIARGDIYQANLSQCFQSEVNVSAPDLYLSLRSENPAPYSAYLDRGDRQILSSSPELFLEVDSERRVATRPIKGTRPRSAKSQEDIDLAQALRENEKEQSELLMIVDMERNDLGRVCETGSVVADREFTVESFASVHHLVGEVRGSLREGVSMGDLLAATFPGGSITGAPKKRAMEIIRDLEKRSRGAYCGTIGFLSAGGISRWNIAIRTIEKKGSTVSFAVGAGIVWDSSPQAEYEETLQKARKILSCLGWSEERLQQID